MVTCSKKAKVKHTDISHKKNKMILTFGKYKKSVKKKKKKKKKNQKQKRK